MNNQANQSTHCESCGASLKKFWHRLSPGLIQALVKFRKAVNEKNKNYIHLQKDLSLTKNEYNNFQKLRFHALIAKTKDAGYWLLTHRGAQFLAGEIQIPKRIQTFRNHIITKDEEMITIRDVIGEMPYFDKKSDIVFDYAGESDMENAKVYRAKKSKIKNPCYKCGTGMKISITDTFLPNGKVKVEEFLKCPKCGEEDFIL